MSSLRNILQRCARKASIPGGTPLQIQCTFNPVYSAYPISISRQTYSSDANENDPVQKYLIEMMNAKKSTTDVAEDQKASKSKIVEDKKVYNAPTFNKTDSMNSRPNIKSWPSVTKDQKVYKASTFNKTDFRPGTLEAQSRTHQLLNTNRELLDEVSALLKRLQSFELKLTSEIQVSHTQTNAKKSRSNVGEDQKVSKTKIAEDEKAGKVPIFEASKAPTFNKTDSMNSRPNIKFWPSVTKDQKAPKAPTFDKTDFRPRTHQLLNTNRELKFRPTVTKDQNAPKAPIFNKNHNLQKSRSNIVPEDKKSTKSFTADSAQKTPFGQFNSKNLTPNVPADQKSESNGISRQAYSNDANEAPKNATFNKTNSVNFQTKTVEDQRSAKAPIFKDQKESNAPIFNKNLNLRKYYITIRGLSKETTHDSLREFYSQFGEIVSGKIIFPGESRQFGNVAFTSREAMSRALNSLLHCIDGKETKNVHPAMLGKKQLTLQVLYLSPKTTKESLRKFYSKFGMLSECWTKQGTTVEMGQVGEVTFAYQKDINRAMDDCPHVINGKPMKLRLLGKGHSTPVSLFVGSLPENVTEETLRDEFSKYGKPVYWELNNDGQFNQSGPYGIVKYATEQEALKVLNSGPHTIKGSVVDVRKANDANKLGSKEMSNN